MSGRILLAASLALLLAGCGLVTDGACTANCSPCPLHASVEVSDSASGAPVAGVSVTSGGVAWLCLTGAKTVCTTVTQVPAEPFDAAVSAPGHTAATVRLSPTLQYPASGCCPPCQTFPTGQVRLVPL